MNWINSSRHVERAIGSLVIILLTTLSSVAQLRLPAILSSGMVLQQNDSVTFWGWGYNSEAVKIIPSWNSVATVTKVSNIGRWMAKIKTPAAGGPYDIVIKSPDAEIILNDILIGEVWLCSGQSNMEWNYYNGVKNLKEELPLAYNNQLRFFQIPRMASDYPQEDVKASWKLCDSNSLKTFSAVGYYFGKRLNKQLDVPIGLINASWGGTPAEVWTPAEYIEGDTILKKAAALLTEVPWGPIKTAMNYNGMLSPITRFTLAGAIWYQGESNAGTNSTYSRLMTRMIDAWRKKWEKNFPFYYVQIAPFKYGNKNIGALLQEQQTRAMTHPGTGMVVVTDLIDTITDIHPRNKTDVGIRLANWALSETYRQSVGSYKSPMYRQMEMKNDKMILYFDNVPNGWLVKGKSITGFYISANGVEWLDADAKIDKDKIIVWNKKVKQPAHIRFGFGNTIVGNVFSVEGLPLCPFRTDNQAVDQSEEK
jgi:sialate O-acetylesterase